MTYIHVQQHVANALAPPSPHARSPAALRDARHVLSDALARHSARTTAGPRFAVTSSARKPRTDRPTARLRAMAQSAAPRDSKASSKDFDLSDDERGSKAGGASQSALRATSIDAAPRARRALAFSQAHSTAFGASPPPASSTTTATAADALDASLDALLPQSRPAV